MMASLSICLKGLSGFMRTLAAAVRSALRRSSVPRANFQDDGFSPFQREGHLAARGHPSPIGIAAPRGLQLAPTPV